MSAFIKELPQNSLGRASATSSLCLITALHKNYIFFSILIKGNEFLEMLTKKKVCMLCLWGVLLH